MVSVWVGNFHSDDELDDYINLSRQFEEDFGFELNERDMPETSVKSVSLPIDELVKRFSWRESYSSAVTDLAKKHGIDAATTMVVFLNLEYQPEHTKLNENAPLQFLGAVPFK